jgi:hypothetical protein
LYSLIISLTYYIHWLVAQRLSLSFLLYTPVPKLQTVSVTLGYLPQHQLSHDSRPPVFLTVLPECPRMSQPIHVMLTNVMHKDLLSNVCFLSHKVPFSSQIYPAYFLKYSRLIEQHAQKFKYPCIEIWRFLQF